MISVFHSVRWRLQLWHALILMGVIVVLCLLAYRLAANDRQARIDRELESFERAFMRQVWENSSEKNEEKEKNNTPPSTEAIRQRFARLRDVTGLPLEMRSLFDPASTEGPYLAFWDGEGRCLFRSANAPDHICAPVNAAPEGGRQARSVGHYREIVRGGSGGFRGVSGRDISADLAGMRTLRWQIAACGTGLWLVGLLGGWWLAGRAIQPIDEIGRTASRIAEGSVSERINLADTDNELGRLSRVLNETFDRLESAIQRQREFTADASHELRTPLTVILSETSRGLKREREPEHYREILGTCHHAATRMRTLVEALLVLARQDGHHGATAAAPCNLATLAGDALTLLQPLADQRAIRLHAELGAAGCEGDAQTLAMVAVNLISNAIDHQAPDGEVTVRTGADAESAWLSVADSGPGIAAEHLPRLFDRFYRIDPARGPATGHSGLGLAIVKAIVDRHHGAIAVDSVPGRGSTFRVTLPLQGPRAAAAR